MIKRITLKNFKLFKDEVSFPISRINLLTGVNGRGKSSLLQSMLLMRQSNERNDKAYQIEFNGSCVNLGEFSDVRNSNVPLSNPINFTFEFDHFRADFPGKSSDFIYSLTLTRNDKEDIIADINRVDFSGYDEKKIRNLEFEMTLRSLNNYDMKLTVPKDETCLAYLVDFFPVIIGETDAKIELWRMQGIREQVKFGKVHYVSADRIGPRTDHVRNSPGNFPNVGAKGENTVAVLYSYLGEEEVNIKLYLGQDENTLRKQTEEWLRKVFGIAKLEIPPNKGNTINLLLNGYKPENVGFGYSFVLPIIVSGLLAKENEVLIVENPEAHLHPKAQSELAKFLALVASTGIQVFIESHSEHFMNGLRLSCVGENPIISNKDLNILYFTPQAENYYLPIPVDEKAGISNWPTDFFDQASKDYLSLYSS